MDPDPVTLFFLLLPQYAVSSLSATFVLSSLAALIALLLLSAVFSGSEVALFSLTDPAKEALAERDDPASRRVLQLLERPRQVLITILILNTFVNVAAAILAAVLTGRVAAYLNWNHTVAVLLEVLVLTFVILVMSEITPKLIATRHATAFSRAVSGPLAMLHYLLNPLSTLLARSTQLLRRRMGPNSSRISSADLKALADVGQAHGTLEEEERELIYSIVEFGETSVREIMVSRLDVVALPITASFTEALEIIRTTGHSRMPLYVDHLDNIMGIVYAKDLLPLLPSNNGSTMIDWARAARPAIFVPLGKKLDELLKDFQAKKTHIAIVVDEYGGTAGLVTLEDVLEEIVGEIRDEHDESEDLLYERIDRNTYVFDARIDLDEVNELFDADLDTEAYDFETLGGLIFHVMGSIPKQGDEIDFDTLHMRVVTVETHRIGLVRVQRVDPELERDVADTSSDKQKG
ncbi:MAG: hemolysin family protein [Rhodothermales bacterium]